MPFDTAESVQIVESQKLLNNIELKTNLFLISVPFEGFCSAIKKLLTKGLRVCYNDCN